MTICHSNLKEQLLVEHNNTNAIEGNPSYLPLPTKHDLRRDENHDTSIHYCVWQKARCWEAIQRISDGTPTKSALCKLTDYE